MNKIPERVFVTVDLDAVEANFREMRKGLTPGTQMIAVVKADGYGHGAVPLARMLQKKDYIWGFAVAEIREARKLRDEGIFKPILILGYVFPEDYEEMVKMEVRPAVFTYEMAKQISDTAARYHRAHPIHLAVDTGMTRIGFRHPKESIEEILHICQLPNIRLEGLFTHFAKADEKDLSSAREQFATYMEFVRKMEEAGLSIPLRHCNNSAGILWHREGDLDAVRPGITIYGIYPSDEVITNGAELTPVMEWKSHIAYVKDVEAGVGVSYGATYVTSQDNTRIATIPVGYADGYPRSLSNKGWVLIHGRKAPILGRVCMDQFMVDVTDIPEAAQGDAVTLMGWDGDSFLGIDTLGRLSGRFPYELVCCISQRVPRIYLGSEENRKAAGVCPDGFFVSE